MSGLPPVPRLDVVIVNWNSGSLLRECVASLAALRPVNFTFHRVVVVDNGSSDESAEGLSAESVPLVVMRNATNRGFAAACNQGAAASSADYILFLNPDTRLSDDSLTPAMGALENPAMAGVGILGVRLVDATGTVQRTCARAPTLGRLLTQACGLNRLSPGRFPACPMTDWDHGETRDVDQVMGAFLIIRRPLFENLSGFDERFFVYYDDVDLCLRARLAGWRVVYFTGAQSYHKGCGTTGGIHDTRLFYFLRSRMLYAGKHFTVPSALCVMAVTLVIELLIRLAWAAFCRSPREAADVLRAGGMLWADLPSCLPKIFVGKYAVSPPA